MPGNSEKTLSRGYIFQNSTPNNGTQRREQINWILEYQQRVDAVTTEKMRRSYTFCDVQAGRRSTMNTIEYLNDEWGRSRHQIISYTYLRRVSNWLCLTEIRVAVRNGTETPMDKGRKEQFRNYWMTKRSLNNTKRRSTNRRRLDGNTCSWERWRADGDNVGRAKYTSDRA